MKSLIYYIKHTFFDCYIIIRLGLSILDNQKQIVVIFPFIFAKTK